MSWHRSLYVSGVTGFRTHSSGFCWKYLPTGNPRSAPLSSLRLDRHGSMAETSGTNALTDLMTSSMFHAMSS